MEFKRLKDLVNVDRGSRLIKKQLKDGGQYAVINGGKPLGYWKEFNMPKNTITVAQVGVVGKINWQTEKFWAGDECGCLIAKNQNFNYKFLFYFLKSIETRFLKAVKGGTVGHLDQNIYNTVLVPLPLLNQQQKIAHLLNNFENAIKQLLPLLEREKELRKQQFKFYLNHICKNIKVDGINLKELKKLVIVKRGGEWLGKKVLEDEKNSNNYPVYNGGLKPVGYWKEFNTPANSMVIYLSANLAGLIKWFDFNFYASNHCCRLFLNSNQVVYKYLFYFLHSKQMEIFRMQYGVGIKHFPLEKFLNIKVPLPLLEQQKKIANWLTKYEAAIDKITVQIPAEIELRKQQYQYYLNQIFLHLK